MEKIERNNKIVLKFCDKQMERLEIIKKETGQSSWSNVFAVLIFSYYDDHCSYYEKERIRQKKAQNRLNKLNNIYNQNEQNTKQTNSN